MRRRLVGLFAIGFTLGTAVDGLAQAIGSDLTVGRPTVLFEGGYTRDTDRTFPEYDVSLDGGHFLMVAPGIPAAKARGQTRRSWCSTGSRNSSASGLWNDAASGGDTVVGSTVATIQTSSTHSRPL